MNSFLIKHFNAVNFKIDFWKGRKWNEKDAGDGPFNFFHKLVMSSA